MNRGSLTPPGAVGDRRCGADGGLPPELEAPLRKYGVIKPARWPRFDQLTQQIAERGFRMTIAMETADMAVARVFAGAREFVGSDSTPERALTRALIEALVATSPRQLMLSPVPVDDQLHAPDPAGRMTRPDRGSRPHRRNMQDMGEELVWDDGAGAYVGVTTGTRIVGAMADIIRGSMERIDSRRQG